MPTRSLLSVVVRGGSNARRTRTRVAHPRNRSPRGSPFAFGGHHEATCSLLGDADELAFAPALDTDPRRATELRLRNTVSGKAMGGHGAPRLLSSPPGVCAAERVEAKGAVASLTSPRLLAPASRPPAAVMSRHHNFVVVAYLGVRGPKSVTSWALAPPVSLRPVLLRRLLVDGALEHRWRRNAVTARRECLRADGNR